MSIIDIKTKDTINMIKQQVKSDGINLDYINWEYVEKYINRQLQETYEDGLENKSRE